MEKRLNKRIIVPVILVLIVGLVGGILWHIKSRRDRARILKVSGNIEVTEVRTSFRVEGKIVELLVDEGFWVTKGQLIARLDTDELSKKRDEAKGEYYSAEYAYRQAEEDYQRYEALYKVGSISQQKRDTAKTNRDEAQAKVASCKAAWELSEVRLGFTDLTSSLDGVILTKSSEAGEVVKSGTVVFTIGDIQDMWLTAYVHETQLCRIKLNQQVDIKTDTYPHKIYKGRIEFISDEAEFTPKPIQTTEERVKLVYRIKVKIENPNLELKPGMPADGFIKVQS